ncbi:MAG: D-erythronate dehydrogenase [Solirubrobacteraceae bacterium]
MRVVVIGAAGMIGSRLAARLARDAAIAAEPISHLLLVDAVPAARVDGGGRVTVQTLVADIVSPGVASEIVSARPHVIFDLAAVVSGEAEADFELGYRVNLDATRSLFDAIAAVGGGYRPRLVFSSSIAVFGPPLPDVIGDEQRLTPATSYGTQKAIVELLLSDYTRRGILDGVGVRLPTICVRPGTANRAASGFFSSIIREPLNGERAILPVADDVRHWFASPRAAVQFLVHAASLAGDALGAVRSLTMPGVSASVAMEIEALRRLGGEHAVSLISREPDETIARIVGSWPKAFDARRAQALGFRAETSFEELVHVHLEDELAR